MNRFARTILGTTALAVALSASMPTFAETSSSPSWNPRSSERLVKLPASYLKKSIDSDFVESALGQAINSTEENIGLKAGTLSDLQKAVGEANDPDLKLELRHQFLAEKRAFVDLMGQRIDLNRKHAETKLKLFEDMLKKLDAKTGANSPARAELIEKQEAAKTRFESALAKVDMRVFQTASVSESKYAKKYAENMQAIEQLTARIADHEANQSALGEEGEPLSKKEYIRRMMADAQTELALLDQENTVLGYMAKLVGLDALALSEQTMDAELADSPLPGDANVIQSVSFFLNN